MIVNVTGQQFTWSFEYPDQKVNSNELVLPKDRPIEFRIHTKDVLHSFWVPEFRLKSDAVPGLTTKIRVTPDRLGRYQVVCAELCGLGHSTMRQNVRVVAPAGLQRLDRQPQADRRRRRPARRGAAGGGGAKPDGAALFAANGCGSCHTFKPANATGTVGPDLDKIDHPTAAFIHQSIADPNKVVTKGFNAGHHAPGLRHQALA